MQQNRITCWSSCQSGSHKDSIKIGCHTEVRCLLPCILYEIFTRTGCFRTPSEFVNRYYEEDDCTAPPGAVAFQEKVRFPMVRSKLHRRKTLPPPTHLVQHSSSLQRTLWIVWTVAVIATAYISWHHDILAHLSVNYIGLVIHCFLAGIVGLVVMTLIEMRLEPQRFMDEP